MAKELNSNVEVYLAGSSGEPSLIGSDDPVSGLILYAIAKEVERLDLKCAEDAQAVMVYPYLARRSKETDYLLKAGFVTPDDTVATLTFKVLTNELEPNAPFLVPCDPSGKLINAETTDAYTSNNVDWETFNIISQAALDNCSRN